LILSFSQEELSIQNFDKMADETRQMSKRAIVYQGVIGGTLFTLTMGYLIFCLSVASVFILHAPKNYFTGNNYDVAELVTASACSVFACQSIGIVAPIIPTIIQGLISQDAVHKVIERTPEIRSKKDAAENIKLRDKIYFEKVSFRYPTQIDSTRDILSNASFSINAGESTAIVGPSGSGKSTIIQLL
jgi:ABC-type multidrug transport system fused ATPase/permease subunit